MIIGTAGHIDHGKTTLVRALTGVDTDRLPEEKSRGISIELGYAFLDAPDGTRLGFIDVPGHERLVHTMLSGATGIDLALLLVAADDGVMPQTREHLAVLCGLGLTRALVVLTKADRADAARQAAVRAEVADLLQGTPLAAAPVLAVSATTGDGLGALKDALFEAAAAVPPRAARERAFRLAVDRAFTLHGTGTVVTGTIHAGRVAVGDELRLVPGDRPARVRSLHAQNRAVQEAVAGERCAIALVGLERDQITRGQWVVDPACARTTDRLDVSLTLWHEEGAWLRSGTVVHVHVGAASTMGTVAVLRPEALAPGTSGLVQLVLRQPLGAWHGDRVVLRDAAASRTLAGGTVLDPDGPVRYRRTPQRLAQLDALQAGTPAERVRGWLAAGTQGLDLRRFAAAQGLRAIPPLPEGVLRHTDARGDWALDGGQAAAAQALVLQALADYHRQQPDELGPDAGRLRRLALPRWPEPLWAALLARLQAQGALLTRGAFVHLSDHGVRLSATEERIAQKVAPLLDAAGFEGAWVRDLARDTQESEALMRVTLARLSQRGELHQIVKDLYHPLPTVASLVTLVRQVADEGDGEVTAARFRDVTGLGRKRAIQILEHFDRIGLLRRVGDVHRLRRDSALLASPAAEGACAAA